MNWLARTQIKKGLGRTRSASPLSPSLSRPAASPTLLAQSGRLGSALGGKIGLFSRTPPRRDELGRNRLRKIWDRVARSRFPRTTCTFYTSCNPPGPPATAPGRGPRAQASATKARRASRAGSATICLARSQGDNHGSQYHRSICCRQKSMHTVRTGRSQLWVHTDGRVRQGGGRVDARTGRPTRGRALKVASSVIPHKLSTLGDSYDWIRS